MQQAVHVWVGEIAKEFALWSILVCSGNSRHCQISPLIRQLSSLSMADACFTLTCGRWLGLEQLALLPSLLLCALYLQQQVASGSRLLPLHNGKFIAL